MTKLIKIHEKNEQTLREELAKSEYLKEELINTKEQLIKSNEKIAELAEIGMKNTQLLRLHIRLIKIYLIRWCHSTLPPESVKEIFQKKFTYKHLIDGKEGITDFTLEFILRENGNINWFVLTVHDVFLCILITIIIYIVTRMQHISWIACLSLH